MKHIMKQFFLSVFTIFIFVGCSVHHQNVDLNTNTNFTKNMRSLALQIKSISDKINKEEARSVAYSAITYSKHLANEYEVVAPALFHNTLINMNIKEKGLCYHYANDLLKYLKEKDYKSFKFIKIISNRGEYFEHTSIAITANNVSLDNSIVLDAWRDTGNLFYSKIKNDKRYKWEKKYE